MPAQTTNLFLLEDLEEASGTRKLAEGDLHALHAVADWIKAFVAKPHKDLGRAGPVCPFVPAAIERKPLWLAPERVSDRSVADVAQLVRGYKKLLLDQQPNDGAETNYQSMVVVFSDLSADRAKDILDGVLEQLGVLSYVDDGLVLGGFYQRSAAAAIYNAGFRPFTPPIPFPLMRHAVVSDRKFFLNMENWLDLWARHHGGAAVHALAEELRGLPWPARREP